MCCLSSLPFSLVVVVARSRKERGEESKEGMRSKGKENCKVK